MEHVYLLQENINTCIAYYESGQFKRDHPEDAHLPLVIVLVPIEPLAEEGEKLIEAARPVVESVGMKIVVDQDFALDPDKAFSDKAY